MVGHGTTDEFWDYVMQTVRDLTSLSYYDLLGVDQQASGDVVVEAYYRLLRQLHPDVYGAERNRVRQRALTRLTARIGEAYRTLSDPKRRAEYDRVLAQGKRRLLVGDDSGKPQGRQDPASESAKKLWEQGLEHLEVGELTRARAQLVLAKSFEPQSKAINRSWDRLLQAEHDKLNAKRVARGFAAQPYESSLPPDGDSDEFDDDDAPTNPPGLESPAEDGPTQSPSLMRDMLDAGVAAARDAEADDGDTAARSEPPGAVPDDTIRRAVLDLGGPRTDAESDADILRSNAIVPEPGAHVYESPETVRDIDPGILSASVDQTIDEDLDDPGHGDDDIAVEVAADEDIADADTMFEPYDAEVGDSTQQLVLDDMVSPPLRVRVGNWDQAAKLYELVRDCKGLYIRSSKDAYVAQRVEVDVVLPTEETIQIGAIVRDVVLPGDASGKQPGLGVEFTGIDETNRDQVERLKPAHNES